MKRVPLEAIILLYFLSYLPNVIVTKLVTSTPHGGLGRPLTGLETLFVATNPILPEEFSAWLIMPKAWAEQHNVVGVTNLADHSEVEVLAYPLDKSQRPQANDSGNGRFIAVMPGYVESLDYPAGGLITVNGQLEGSRAGKVGQADYVFPLVQVDQSHVWTADEMSKGKNNVHFGVGVGVGIR